MRGVQFPPPSHPFQVTRLWSCPVQWLKGCAMCGGKRGGKEKQGRVEWNWKARVQEKANVTSDTINHTRRERVAGRECWELGRLHTHAPPFLQSIPPSSFPFSSHFTHASHKHTHLCTIMHTPALSICLSRFLAIPLLSSFSLSAFRILNLTLPNHHPCGHHTHAHMHTQPHPHLPQPKDKHLKIPQIDPCTASEPSFWCYPSVAGGK